MHVTTLWAVSFFPVCFFLFSSPNIQTTGLFSVCVCVWRLHSSGESVCEVVWIRLRRWCDSQVLLRETIVRLLGIKTCSQDVERGPVPSDITSCFCDVWFEGKGKDCSSWLYVASHKSKSGCRHQWKPLSRAIETSDNSCRNTHLLYSNKIRKVFDQPWSGARTSCLFTVASSTQRTHC